MSKARSKKQYSVWSTAVRRQTTTSFNESQIRPDFPNLNSTFCPSMLFKRAQISVNYFKGRNIESNPQSPWQDGYAQSQPASSSPTVGRAPAMSAAITKGVFKRKPRSSRSSPPYTSDSAFSRHLTWAVNCLWSYKYIISSLAATI